MPLSKSAKYYRDNPDARKKKNEYQKTFNKKREQVVNRVGLNRENRERGTYGNGDGLDVSHMKDGSTRLEKASKNRGNKTRSRGDKKSRG